MSRRWSMRLAAAITVIAAVAVVAMANYISAGHVKRFQWTDHGQIQLHPQTARILQSLTNDVTITIFFNPRDQMDLHSMVSALLEEYRNANPRRIKLRRLDYTRFDGEAKLLLARHNLATPESRDFVLFESEGRAKPVFSAGMIDYDLSGLFKGEEVRASAFRGEMLFTAAMFSVLHPRPVKAYFLSGHGEHDPGNTQLDGYSQFASVLADENNIQWERLKLQGTNAVPDDCQLLIIAGAKAGFLDSELERIHAYLTRGGRAFILLGSEGTTRLERLLEEWNVAVGGLVKDEAFSSGGAGLMPHFDEEHLKHPVMKRLAGNQRTIYLVLPREVAARSAAQQGAGAPEVLPLAVTSEDATDGRERRSFPLIVSVQQGGIQGLAMGETRLLVAGDSLFLGNGSIDLLGNRLFASLAVNWLADRPQIWMDGILPQPIQAYKLVMTSGQLRAIQWMFLGVMPAGVLALGGIVWLKRRW